MRFCETTAKFPFMIRVWWQWVVATVLAGLATCLLILIGVVDFSWGFFGPRLLGGVLLGFTQGFILRRYLNGQIWLTWTLWSSLAWLGAMVILFLGELSAGIGSGLNDVDTSDFFILACGLSGFVYGVIQRIQTRLNEGWILVNVVTWAVGSCAGLVAGKWLYFAITPTIYVELDKPWGVVSIVAGSLCAVFVYGVTTGAGMAYYLLRLTRPRDT